MRTAKPSPQSIYKNERGQIVFEYVLLLVIGVSIAILITSTMVSRNPDSPGFLIAKWYAIITTIGADHADDLTPTDP